MNTFYVHELDFAGIMQRESAHESLIDAVVYGEMYLYLYKVLNQDRNVVPLEDVAAMREYVRPELVKRRYM